MRHSPILLTITWLAIAVAAAPVSDNGYGLSGGAVGLVAIDDQTPGEVPASAYHLTRDLAQTLDPLLQSTNGLTTGLGAGVQSAAPLLGSAVANAGSGLSELADAVGSVTQGTVSGNGNTVGSLPSSIYTTTQDLQESGGVAGSVLSALVGRGEGDEDDGSNVAALATNPVPSPLAAGSPVPDPTIASV